MPRKWLWLVALGALAWRGWVSAALPMTGDEALFYWWARFLDYGYYDHPPMVAWWIAAARAVFGDAAWAVRLPATLMPLGVGWAMWWGWSPASRERAAWAVLLYWLMPVNWLNALIVTDTPLIFWAAWSAAAMARAEAARERVHEGKHGGAHGPGTRAGVSWPPFRLHALSGAFLGLAFLSKYFAVLLGVAYAVYFAVFARARWRGFLVMAACALPAVALNVAWNIDHCWANVMFNVFNRNDGAAGSWKTVAVYVAMVAYLMSPVLLWQALRQRRAWCPRPPPPSRASLALPACLALVPLLIFLLLSTRKDIGLHWVMGFYPFCFLLAAFALPDASVRSAGKGLAVWLAAHLLVAAGVAATDLRDWREVKNYHRLVEAARAAQMVAQARAPGVVLASNVYSSAALFGHALGAHVPVIGPGSVHARQDDLTVDPARLEGRTLRILATRRPAPQDFAPYFDSVRLLTFEQDGAPFYAVEGTGFRYEAYRRTVMATVNQRYYQFPTWLPVRACAFCQRYCGHARCPSGPASPPEPVKSGGP